MYPGTASSTRTALVARLARPRTRAAVAIVLALVAEAAIFVPLRDWDEPAVLAAIGVLIAVLAGAFGGLVAGVVAAAVGFALQFRPLRPVRDRAGRAPRVARGRSGFRLAGDALAQRRGCDRGAPRARGGQVPRAHGAPARRDLSPAWRTSARRRSRSARSSTDCWATRPTSGSREPGLFLKLVHPEDSERVEAELARDAGRPCPRVRVPASRARRTRRLGSRRRGGRARRFRRADRRAGLPARRLRAAPRRRGPEAAARRRGERCSRGDRPAAQGRRRRAGGSVPRRPRSTTARRCARSPHWRSASSPTGASSTCSRRTARSRASRSSAARARRCLPEPAPEPEPEVLDVVEGAATGRDRRRASASRSSRTAAARSACSR